MSNSTTVEQLNFLYDAMKHLPESQVDVLRQVLGITEKDEERLKGLESQTEFEIMALLLGQVKSLTGTDESTAAMSNTPNTDFLITTLSGRKLAIEVKSSKETKIKISSKLINEKMEFAQSVSHELYFAIKLKGHWLLLSGQYIAEQNGKITIEKDYLASEFEDLLGERSFLFTPTLEMLSIYSKTKPSISGIVHPEHGNLIRWSLKFNNKRLFNITVTHQESLAVSFVLENLQNVMSAQYQEIINLDKDRVLIKERLTQNTFLKLSAFIIAPITHTINEKFNKGYTLAQFKEHLKKDKSYQKGMTRKLVMATLALLDEKGYPVVMFLGNKGYRISDLKV